MDSTVLMDTFWISVAGKRDKYRLEAIFLGGANRQGRFLGHASGAMIPPKVSHIATRSRWVGSRTLVLASRVNPPEVHCHRPKQDARFHPCHSIYDANMNIVRMASCCLDPPSSQSTGWRLVVPFQKRPGLPGADVAVVAVVVLGQGQILVATTQ